MADFTKDFSLYRQKLSDLGDYLCNLQLKGKNQTAGGRCQSGQFLGSKYPNSRHLFSIKSL